MMLFLDMQSRAPEVQRLTLPVEGCLLFTRELEELSPEGRDSDSPAQQVHFVSLLRLCQATPPWREAMAPRTANTMLWLVMVLDQLGNQVLV